MPAIKLYGNLRDYIDGSQLTADGPTIGAVLDALGAAHAGLGAAVRADDGTLQPYVRVLVNGHDVMLGQGLATPVSETDQIAIFPPIAGG